MAENQDPIEENLDPVVPVAEVKWNDNLGEGLSDHPSILKFKDVPGLAKSYVELEKKIGSNTVVVPKDDADDAVKAEFYNKIGRPESAEKYEFTKLEGLHEKAALTDEGMKGFKEASHSLGLTKTQADGLLKYYLEDVSGQLRGNDEASTNSVAEAETALRREWGSGYDTKMAIAKQLIGKFGGNDADELLNNPAFGNSPKVLKILANLGSKMSEDGLGVGGDSAIGMTVSQAQTKINEIQNDFNHPYHVAEHGQHNDAVTYMKSLYAIANPE